MNEDAMFAGGIHLWQLYSTVKNSEKSNIEESKLNEILDEVKSAKKPSQKKSKKSSTKKQTKAIKKISSKDSLKSKLKKKKDSKKTSNDSDSEEKVDLEEIIDENNKIEDDSEESEEITIDDFEEIDSDVIDYSPLEREFLMQQTSYLGNKSSYFSSFEADFNPYKAKPVDGYALQDTLTMDAQEASDRIENLMTESLTGSGYSNVNHKDKERLTNWITFNHAEFKLYEATSVAPTRDTNFQYNA